MINRLVRDNGFVREATITEGAALAAATVVTANATVGNSTLTAASIAPGVTLVRTGSTGAYADTMPAATLLTAAFPDIVDGQSYVFRISNRVAFADTLTAGSGTTAQAGAAVIVAASTGVDVLMTRTSATAWTFGIIG